MNNTITIRGSYLLTVIVSVLLVFIGHKIAVGNLHVQREESQEIVQAKVLRVTDRVSQVDEFDELMPKLGDNLFFEAVITGGIRNGELVTASQRISGFSGVTAKEISPGDSVLLINFDDVWFFNGYFRTNKMLGLGIFFVLCVMIFGRRKGFNTVLSLGLTCGSIFAVFIPAILSGMNIYLMSMLICVYTTVMTLLIVIGYNRKSLTAVIGCISGIAVSGIVTVIMSRILSLSGIIDEHSRYLASLPIQTQIDLKAVIFAGITIGAMGAIMDVAMSISSSMWEIKEKAADINFKTLFHSGITIGRDIMGTMANTLVLAYIGSSLSVVLILSVYSNSLLSLFNSEMIIVEILQALTGSLGILFAMPLTAFFSTVFYLKTKKNRVSGQSTTPP
jgi:uncharacterized membrane protein